MSAGDRLTPAEVRLKLWRWKQLRIWLPDHTRRLSLFDLDVSVRVWNCCTHGNYTIDGKPFLEADEPLSKLHGMKILELYQIRCMGKTSIENLIQQLEAQLMTDAEFLHLSGPEGHPANIYVG